jgi:hypothetical protein
MNIGSGKKMPVKKVKAKKIGLIRNFTFKTIFHLNYFWEHKILDFFHLTVYDLFQEKNLLFGKGHFSNF